MPPSAKMRFPVSAMRKFLRILPTPSAGLQAVSGWEFQCPFLHWVVERIKRVLDRNRTLCPNLNGLQKLAIFGLSVPVFVLVAGAQTSDRPPKKAQISPAASQGRRQPRIAAPMFSPEYVNALQGVLDMEPRGHY